MFTRDGLGALILFGAAIGCGSESSVEPLKDEYVLSDQELVPESGDFDPTSRSFYVSSATKGDITRVEADGTESIFYAAPTGEDWRSLGAIIDDAARRLWVCAQRPADETQQIWALDLDTGERELALDLGGVEAGSTCNDIAVDADGLAYITDSENSRVYRADPDAGTVATWADDPLLSPNAGGVFGGNGIAVTEDGSYVIVSKTGGGALPPLVRIARDDPTSIAEIVTTPFFADLADGISFLDGDLYIALVTAGNVARLSTDDDWATAAVEVAPAMGMTSVTGTSTVRDAEGALYAIYSDISSSIVGSDLNPPFRIFKVDLESFE